MHPPRLHPVIQIWSPLYPKNKQTIKQKNKMATGKMPKTSGLCLGGSVHYLFWLEPEKCYMFIVVAIIIIDCTEPQV